MKKENGKIILLVLFLIGILLFGVFYFYGNFTGKMINEGDFMRGFSGEGTYSLEELNQKYSNTFWQDYPDGQYPARDIYFIEPFLSSLISMYEATQNVTYIELALENTENQISLMEDVDGDGFNEWLEGNTYSWDHDDNISTSSIQYCLGTTRGARQITRLARVIKNSETLNFLFGDRADSIVQVIKHDVVNHPYCIRRFVRPYNTVHHIVSHPLLILLELYLIEGNQRYIEDGLIVYSDGSQGYLSTEDTYLEYISSQGELLKNTLFPQEEDENAVTYGSTLCVNLNSTYPLCYNGGVCQDSLGNNYCSPTDTSHSENFVFTATELYRAGLIFNKSDIDKLSYTFLNRIWDGNYSDPKFRDFTDGNIGTLGIYTEWTLGSNLAPGWVGLGAFNDTINNIFKNGDLSDITNKGWLNELAFYAELARNQVVEDCIYTNRAREIIDGIDNDCDGLIDEDNLVASCIVDESDNLVSNPCMIFDSNDNGIPDNWTKYAADATHILSWVHDIDKNSKVLKSEYTSSGNHNSFGWTQMIDDIEPNTWYEFSFDYKTEDVNPIFAEDGVSFLVSSLWIGSVAKFHNSTGDYIGGYDNGIWAPTIQLKDWNESIGAYRQLERNNSLDWTSVSKYFKTSKNTAKIEIKTYNYPSGRIYFDNFKLTKSEDYGSTLVPIKRSGTLDLIQYKGEDFFPIILYGMPKQDGIHLDIDFIKSNGFNTVNLENYRGYSIDETKSMLLEKDLANVLTFTVAYYYYNESGKLNKGWIDDPNHLRDYVNFNMTKTRIDNWANFPNLFGFNSMDERDYPSSSENFKGLLIPTMNAIKAPYDYAKEKIPNAHVITNYCGLQTDGIDSYTGIKEDMIHYYPYDDLRSYTLNAGRAYSYGSVDASLGNIGWRMREAIQQGIDLGYPAPVLAFGLGVHEWSNWDGTLEGTDYSDDAHQNRYIPFNLQRFQIWDQIINGATGAWFWGTYHIETNNSYNDHHLNQILTISKELSSLQDILLEPEFYDDWDISDSRIDVMMKKHNNKIYLFTASTHYEDLNDVTITLPSYKINSVRAINEIDNGNISHVFNRTLDVESSGQSFIDDFIGENSSAIQGKEAPGYAVHIYEIEVSDIMSVNVGSSVGSADSIGSNNPQSQEEDSSNNTDSPIYYEIIEEENPFQKDDSSWSNFSPTKILSILFLSILLAFIVYALITIIQKNKINQRLQREVILKAKKHAMILSQQGYSLEQIHNYLKIQGFNEEQIKNHIFND